MQLQNLTFDIFENNATLTYTKIISLFINLLITRTLTNNNVIDLLSYSSSIIS